MGNTIRREPISSRIPDSPDYKYLNITDFRGIDISDNPFTLNSNTASDMLNLYVDETNTLTTRPRLEKIVTKPSVLTEFLGIYPISLGYLIHYKENGVFAMDVVVSVDNGYTYYTVSGALPKGKKLTVFEQNDKIYILDGSSYKVISYDVYNLSTSINIADVTGYIPTINVGKTPETSGTSLETYNVLSDSYKETYFWDGSWSPSSLISEADGEEINNKYINNIDKTVNIGFTPLKILSTSITDTPKSLNGMEVLGKNTSVSGTELFVYKVFEDSVSIQNRYGQPSILPSEYDSIYGDCSADGSIVVYYYYSSSASSSGIYGGLYVKRGDIDFVDLSEGNVSYNASINPVKMSGDGDTIAVICWINGNKVLRIYKYNHETSKYTIAHEHTDSSINDLRISNNGKLICFNTTNNTNRLLYETTSAQYKTRDVTGVLAISPDGNIVLTQESSGFVYSGFMTDNIQQVFFPADIKNKLHINSTFTFSADGTKLYQGPAVHGVDEGWLILNNITDAKYVSARLTNRTTSVDTVLATNDTIFYCDSGTSTTTQWGKTYFDFSNTEPLLEITKKINLTSDYDDWNSRRKSFLKSLLTIRFDNNRWFATRNTLYRTQYNDPTYIDISTYNNLGETDEEITGFNLVRDDLMVVYKDNYIWTVTPQTYTNVSGATIYDYAYQETKNTVGNNAIGASIVSTYSEIPLQIAYDGVYGLKQLTNVYASDRISELLSEDITSKWINEDKDVVRCTLTLNKLYWTYFILPYDKVVKYENGLKKEYKNITKIYLLDNRTKSWFYWELPIKVVNAFVKDNITHLSDSDGNLYQLTTEDVVTEYSTEYYDDGKKIINWYWKSQILPLGTINYSKKLIDTTFIFTDTDANDEYGLNYTYYAYRRNMSKTNETTISNTLNYVQSTTKKTLIPRVNFIQLELSNVEDDLNNNKLRLVGLGLKYVLLEGLL